MRVCLLRHAESAPGPGIAERDWPLSPRGRAQARAIVSRLTALAVERVVCSPYPRALDTVAPFAAAAGLPIEVDERLRERSWGGGLLDDFEHHAQESWRDLDYRVAGGETCRECLSRFSPAIDELVAAGRSVLVGSHGTAIGLYLRARGFQLDYARWRAMTMPHLYVVEIGSGPRLLADEPLA